jgi:hypothetical protein
MAMKGRTTSTQNTSFESVLDVSQMSFSFLFRAIMVSNFKAAVFSTNWVKTTPFATFHHFGLD